MRSSPTANSPVDKDLSYWPSIVRIEVDSGWGTGFVVTERHVLTAFHVVGDAEGNTARRIVLRFSPTGHFEDPSRVVLMKGKVLRDMSDRDDDYALIECLPGDTHDGSMNASEIPKACKPLRLRQRCRLNEPFSSPGFAEEDEFGWTGGGKVSSLSDPMSTGGHALGLQFDFGNGVYMKGHSGAPVIVDGFVAGLLRSAFLENEKTTSGISHATKIFRPVWAAKGRV